LAAGQIGACTDADANPVVFAFRSAAHSTIGSTAEAAAITLAAAFDVK
jgi:hypothetical protein